MAAIATPGIKNNMYNKLLYHLDLCITSYHLYHQSLIWPWDPYYEQQEVAKYRSTFMNSVREKNAYNSTSQAGVLHGPGSCQNLWPTNANLDPILTDYSQFNPWKAAFVQPEPRAWLLSQPPTFITNKISKVFMSSYQSSPYGSTQPQYYAKPQDAINLLNSSTASKIPTTPVITIMDGTGSPEPSAQDIIYIFEGGTGGVSTRHAVAGDLQSTFHAWSPLGFILCRERGKDTSMGYDVHIVFRGSRSGSGGRAAKQALTGEKGNPDWVTDMDAFSTTNYPIIGPEGNMSMGFSESMMYTLPNIINCLNTINKDKKKAPNNIYITGHSLGGALATMCASALAVGVNPSSKNLITNDILSEWPLDSIQLITYSAPTVGSADFVSFTNTAILPIRVHVSGDPITSDLVKGRHVGADLCLPNPGTGPSTFNHEPMTVRTQLLGFLMKSKVVLPDPPDSSNPNWKPNPKWTPTFSKYSSFYNIVRDCYGTAQKNKSEIFMEAKINDYLTSYQTLFDNLVNTVTTTAHKTLYKSVKTKVITPINNLTGTNKTSSGAVLGTAWLNWVSSITEQKITLADMNGFIMYAGNLSLLILFQKTIEYKWKFNDYFVPFATALDNTTTYKTIFANPAPSTSDFNN